MFSLDVLNAIAEATGAASYELKHEEFAVLRGAKVPATLVEAGFLSNTDDLIRLASVEYQNKLAEGIYYGVIEGFANANAGM
jgi:N-acetylmuramoyl-L-alanine amidase